MPWSTVTWRAHSQKLQTLAVDGEEVPARVNVSEAALVPLGLQEAAMRRCVWAARIPEAAYEAALRVRRSLIHLVALACSRMRTKPSRLLTRAIRGMQPRGVILGVRGGASSR